MLLLAWLGCEPWDPHPVTVPFRLEGAHLALTCEVCHPVDAHRTGFVYRKCVGVGPFGVGPLLDSCLDCHSCDRVLHPQGEAHFPQRSCGEQGCHAGSDLAWADVGGGGGGTGLTPTPGEDSCAGVCHGATWADASPQDSSHKVHLTGRSLWDGPLTCDGCHPAGGMTASSHADGDKDVVMTGLAKGPDGAGSPSYAGGSCSEVYCHGAAMEIEAPLPSWNGGSGEVACGTCHGWPPVGSHIASPLCAACHAPTGGDEQRLDDRSTHIDGLLQEG